MMLDRYGHLLNDDPTAVADAPSNAIEITAVFRTSFVSNGRSKRRLS